MVSRPRFLRCLCAAVSASVLGCEAAAAAAAAASAPSSTSNDLAAASSMDPSSTATTTTTATASASASEEARAVTGADAETTKESLTNCANNEQDIGSSFRRGSDGGNDATIDGVCEQLSRGECPASAVNDDAREEQQQPSKDSSSTSSFECGIYMAPSTIPGAGLGVYTGIDRSVGDVVGSGDVIVPIVDVHYHLQNYPHYNTQNDNVRATVEVTVDYVWNGVEMGMARETAFGTWNAEGVTAYCPGLDAAINCHLALVNVDKSHPQYDSLELHRHKDPGAGAFSPYHNCTTVATTSIPAGAELFKFYGENWFLTRQEVFPNVPLNENYDAADLLIKDMDEMLDDLDLLNTTTSNNHGAATTSPTVDRDLYQVLASSPYKSESRTLNALPDPRHLDVARNTGVRSTNQAGATKSVQELQQRGMCVDTIRPGRSTVKQAGRGAFAQTHFRKGQVVTGTPLLVCDSVEFMTLYNGDWWERSTPPSQRKVGDQLVLNYCHQHPSSPSLFLCPYGYLVNYINHAPTTVNTTITTTTTPTNYAANVRLEWAEHGRMGHNATLLELSPHHMTRASPGLFWRYVATRDISEGDEIFLDYGSAWQQKWDEHVRTFELEHRHRYDASYESAREYNAHHANDTLRTAKEQRRHPYPGHLELRCLNELGANGTKASSRMSTRAALDLWTIDNVGSKCVVTGRDWQHDRYLYRIELEYHVWDNDAGTYVFDSTRVVKRVERSALRFFDVPYSTDLFLPTAFRHPIGIPDDMFPAAWRNYLGYFHQHNEDDDEDDDDGTANTSDPNTPAEDKSALKSMPTTSSIVSGVSVA